MNETTKTYREKGRALFLTAIMVLSLVAISATFAAGPAVAQTANSGGTSISDVSGAANAVDGQESTYNIQIQIDDVDASGTTDNEIVVDLDGLNPDGSSLTQNSFTLSGGSVSNVAYSADTSANTATVTFDASGGTSSETLDLDFDVNATNDVGELGTQSVTYDYDQTGDGTNEITDAAVGDIGVENDLAVDIQPVTNPTGEDFDAAVTVTNEGPSEATGVDLTNHAVTYPQDGGGTNTVSNSNSPNSGNTLASGESVTLAVPNGAIPATDTDVGFVDGGQTVDVSGDNFVAPTFSQDVQISDDGRALIDGEISDDVLPFSDVEDVEDLEITVEIDKAPGTPGVVGDTIVDSVRVGDWNSLAANNPNVTTSQFESSLNPDEYKVGLRTYDDNMDYRFIAEPAGNLSGNFEAFDGLTQPVSSGEGETRNIRLTPIINVSEFQIDQPFNSALADGDDEIVFNIEQVYGDRNGEPIESSTTLNLDVEGADDETAIALSQEGSSIGDGSSTKSIIWDPSTYGPDNPLTITATSTEPQQAGFNFTAADNESAIDIGYGAGPGSARTKQFVTSGEGTLQGYVDNPITTDPVEDASVWVVESSLYEQNEYETTVDISALDGYYDDPTNNDNIDEDSIYLRLVDNETRQVIDPKNYDLRGQDGFSGVNIRELRSLDTNDERQGAGYWIEDRGADRRITFNHTRLAPEDYLVDVSMTGENVSDQRVADSAPANFTRVNETASGGDTFTQDDTVQNVGNASNITAPTDTLSGDDGAPSLVQPNANLTLERTIERSGDSNTDEIEGANYVDSPGFINSAGEDTEGTNGLGRFVLSNLPTDYQTSTAYIGIATKPDFTSDFADVRLDENGNLRFGEDQESSPFAIEPIDPTPGYVDIENFGLHPPLDETGGAPDPSQIEPFDDPSDETIQDIPRDASVDVFTVETRSSEDGALLNATVDIEVPDNGSEAGPSEFNFTGEIVDVIGGDIVSQDDLDTGEIHTGSQDSIGSIDVGVGEAVVLLESDESGETLNRSEVTDTSGQYEPPTNQTGIFAQLANDATATDFTRKSFQGVIVFESGSISGDISNDDELLPNTFVYTAEFNSDDGTYFSIEPNWTDSPTSGYGDIDNNDDVNETVFDMTVRNGANGPVIDSTQATGQELQSYNLSTSFATVSEASVGEFNLLRTKANHNNGDYSMDRVPATDDGTQDTGVDYRRLTAAQFETGDTGNGSTSTPVRTGFTVEGNVVITGAQPLPDDGNGDNGDSDNDGVLDAYQDGNGDTSTDQLRNAIGDWRNNQITTDQLRAVINNWRNS